jgi:hypothetical protein
VRKRRQLAGKLQNIAAGSLADIACRPSVLSGDAANTIVEAGREIERPT